jgi:hypothetical protein
MGEKQGQKPMFIIKNFHGLSSCFSYKPQMFLGQTWKKQPT